MSYLKPLRKYDVEECIERPTETCWGLQTVTLKAISWGSLKAIRILLLF